MLCVFCMCMFVYTRACKCELSLFAWATHLHVGTCERVLVFRRACCAGALECTSACAHTRVCVDERVHVNVWMCVCARVCTVWPRVGSTLPGGASEGAGRWTAAGEALGWWRPRAGAGAPTWATGACGHGASIAPALQCPRGPPTVRLRAAEAQQGRDPEGGLSPLARAGQPWDLPVLSTPSD